MENFVVSARKYRPVTFESVVGQSHITTTLRNAIRTNHLAQAFLFCGPRGVGKTTCARILAKTINCLQLTEDVEPCGVCESCVSFQNNASFNIHELDAASNNSVEDIRNLIDQVRYPPQTGKYKIYIIDEVHMLSQAAFNAFLKTLEEPPSYAIFILATTEKHKILPTILSRCQIFDFNRIQPRDIAEHLQFIADKEGITVDQEALELIGQKADGGLRDALSMFDLNVTFSTDNRLTYEAVLENLHVLDYDYYFRLTDALLEGSTPQSLIIFDEILRKGFDGHLFVVGLLEHFRNLLVSKDPVTIPLLQVSESAMQKYAQQSTTASPSFLLSGMSIAGQCDINYKSAKNQRLLVELCLMKLANLTHVLNLDPQAVEETAKKKVDTVSLNPSKAPNETAPQPGSGPIAQPAATDVPPKRSKLRSTALLTPSLHGAATTPQPTADAPTPTEEEPVVKEPLTSEKLQLAWYQFADKRKREINSTTEEIALRKTFQLVDNRIEIVLDNDHQMDAIQGMRYDLLSFLKRKFDAPTLELQPRVAPQEVNRQPYTSAEKFNYLAEKNPHLKDLQKALGLDVDF
ncbi:DNA polymerase-3 subunit gamma/tau [Dyadobacter jejuensis]|uniref:DNA polymerase III subunit gamma/tau n=1 Tax=Dyadobacter jejuensis TaxID=1082580 RepID=A0A316ALY6_9BACT|nr:DNA polymerase III subunit gamma/tau [Dyadobacter jejuensis]PWJ58279.1 DNA polymerase-3 subunit gamma/tau [Dyadobacter jejuensis]